MTMMALKNMNLALVLLLVFGGAAPRASSFVAKTRTRSTSMMMSQTKNEADTTIPTNSVVSTVAVAGATGRTGQLVVQQLLDRGVSTVVALVRDTKKAEQVFANAPTENLKIVSCDLSNPEQIRKAFTEEQVDAAIWCATGFSNAEQPNPIAKIKQLLGVALAPKRTIDAVGLPAMATAVAENTSNTNGSAPQQRLPRIVMCSSAGVTRPVWDEATQERYKGAAGIPIVRLNPFGILNVKLESEQELRQTCQSSAVPYCIVRPGGLNDDHPMNARPIFSQGDVAVGRIHRADVAKILVEALTEPAAVDKTFEVFTLAGGYPPALSMNAALSRLSPDDTSNTAANGAHLSDETVAATYHVLQQLLPGEQQDAAALAMGQTYEQLDQGQEGRLGPRGEEQAERAAPQPTTTSS